MTQSSMAQFASQAYRGAAVAVPPLRAVVMLLNGAVSCLQKSLQAQEARRFEEGHGHLTRAIAILRGLSLHLDPNRGGAVADQLFATYNALILAALRAYGRPHMRENFQRITAGLLELRDSWDAVDAAARGARMSGDSASRR
ncbi:MULTISPECIES: flagellar export chaperone FliS [Bradyrhizobium]|uniref:Flagellar protein FliS n=1 Tax=Bradyrhizobium aeschynomenes TaxID=2734909 RepID=A0ABX2CN76_9BRAD|nr:MULTISPECIES: flagellar export chaperone FliS [Bradyrhizobium]NPU12701.1 flagellar protein FliS [Bradyrhizobium aeschynomenes]NPU69649.1 flagellar protein FliS [Bradyrhizobium aeschynomenes]NPV25647.1 flagellar protein FliS [Bradyrhizobium aeschynomenes]